MKIELAHDILAKNIYEKGSVEDKMRAKVHELLTDHLVYYNDKRILLNKDDLQYIDPFIDNMELDQEELNLIKESRQQIAKVNRRYLAFAIVAIVLLVIFNIMANSSNYYNEAQVNKDIVLLKELSLKDSLEQVNEKRADSILTVKGNNLAFTKTLVESYDTLKQLNVQLEQEKNIAQSSTLSSLAEVQLKQNPDDPEYAFQLAAKSWELNPQNKLACALLYKIHKVGPYTSTDTSTISHDQYIENLIFQERSQKNRKKLSSEDMNKIFDEQNLVVQDKQEGVKDRVDQLIERSNNKIEKMSGTGKDLLEEK